MAPRPAKPASKLAKKTKTKPKGTLAKAPQPPAQPKGKAKQPAPQAKAKAKPAKNVAAPKAKAKAKPAKNVAAPKAKAKPAKNIAAPKAKPAAAKAPSPKAKQRAAAQPSVARAAREAAAMKKVIAGVIAPAESGSVVVDAYMRDVDHPFKAEMQAVRSIILGASPKIAERIKWNAPSFFYKGVDLGAFHPAATEFAHLVLLFPDGAGLPAKSSVLEGKQKDRREAKFYSMADIETKKRALEKLVKDWVKLRDA